MITNINYFNFILEWDGYFDTGNITLIILFSKTQP